MRFNKVPDYTAHFNNKGCVAIHTILQKLEFLNIICSYRTARNCLTFWLVDFMNFMNFISFIITFIKFKPITKFKKFERHNYEPIERHCRHGTGSWVTGSPGQRFWPGWVGSRVSVSDRCLTRFWVLTWAFIVALFLQSNDLGKLISA